MEHSIKVKRIEPSPELKKRWAKNKGPHPRFGFRRRLAWMHYVYSLGDDGFGWSAERERKERLYFFLRYHFYVDIYPTRETVSRKTRKKMATVKQEAALAVAQWEEDRDMDLFDLEDVLDIEPDSLKHGGRKWIED